MRSLIIALLALCAALPARADAPAGFSLGGDVYLAGGQVTHEAGGAASLFMAGETVRQTAAIAGSAHLAARRVIVAAPVEGSVYAAGMDVTLRDAVAGDATLAAYTAAIEAAVGGALRVAASRVDVVAPIGASALIRADRLRLDAPIEGDAAIATDRIELGDGARIAGTLRLYSNDHDAIDLPESMIAADRVERLPRAEWDGIDRPEIVRLSWWHALGGFLGGVVVVALVAALVAAVAPGTIARMRRRVLARPFATLGYGFLTLSALIGAAVMLALTLVGIFVSPAAIALAALTGFAGYIIGAYSFGAGLVIAIGRGEPSTLGQRVAAAFAGALMAGLIALIPILGWLFVLALSLAGAGALVQAMLRPTFFAADPL